MAADIKLKEEQSSLDEASDPLLKLCRSDWAVDAFEELPKLSPSDWIHLFITAVKEKNISEVDWLLIHVNRGIDSDIFRKVCMDIVVLHPYISDDASALFFSHLFRIHPKMVDTHFNDAIINLYRRQTDSEKLHQTVRRMSDRYNSHETTISSPLSIGLSLECERAGEWPIATMLDSLAEWIRWGADVNTIQKSSVHGIEAEFSLSPLQIMYDKYIFNIDNGDYILNKDGIRDDIETLMIFLVARGANVDMLVKYSGQELPFFTAICTAPRLNLKLINLCLNRGVFIDNKMCDEITQSLEFSKD